MTLVAAVLLGSALWVLLPPPVEPRLASVLPRALRTSDRVIGRDVIARLGAGAAAVGALVGLPTPANAIVAIGALLVLPRLIGRLESRADRRRSDHLSRQAPVVTDLLAATLSSGAPVRAALAAVAGAVVGPAGDHLNSVVASLDLGADPVEAWSSLKGNPALGALADAVVRSARTGAPLSAVLARLADDLRRERRAVVEVAARTAGVRAVVPLAACFLPAFILLGVVPVVAALANELINP